MNDGLRAHGMPPLKDKTELTEEDRENMSDPQRFALIVAYLSGKRVADLTAEDVLFHARQQREEGPDA